MAEIGLTFATSATTVGVLALDALVAEGTDLRAKATEYAVEEGSPISDHVVLESERLKLSGWVTPSNVLEMTADGRPKLLEVNPNPAWANDGKLAFMAGFAGISYPRMLEMIVDAALVRIGKL